MLQASSEHPLAKAVVEYARHFHFFDDSSATKDGQKHSKDSTIPGWLFDVSEFSALPGRGVQCFIDGKRISVSLFDTWPLFGTRETWKMGREGGRERWRDENYNGCLLGRICGKSILIPPNLYRRD